MKPELLLTWNDLTFEFKEQLHSQVVLKLRENDEVMNHITFMGYFEKLEVEMRLDEIATEMCEGWRGFVTFEMEIK